MFDVVTTRYNKVDLLQVLWDRVLSQVSMKAGLIKDKNAMKMCKEIMQVTKEDILDESELGDRHRILQLLDHSLHLKFIVDKFVPHTVLCRYHEVDEPFGLFYIYCVANFFYRTDHICPNCLNVWVYLLLFLRFYLIPNEF